MSIHFDPARWEEVKQNYSKWWSCELERPLIHMTVSGCESDRPKSELPHLNFFSHYDLSIPVDKIVDAVDYDLTTKRFLADSFPTRWLNFGPGVMATFTGADLMNTTDSSWFRPRSRFEIKDLKIKFDPTSVWYRRIADLAKCMMDRWQGQVQVGMTDLGGSLDVVSTFRPNEALLLDLYDYPDEVKRVLWETHECWFQSFEALNSILQPRNPGYTAWTAIFSQEPYYMLQCDFAYMISPQMFDEFVKPELAASCRRLKNAFYHLDGVGQLPHLDSLLSIPELKGVQWIPGAGKPDCSEWPEVYRKIRKAGKLIQIYGTLDTLDRVAGHLGSGRGIILFASVDRKDEKKTIERLKNYI